MVADCERKRARHTRSKRGCTVCRARRVKCDETRPACNKCTSTGRKCEGFPTLVLWKATASPPVIRSLATAADCSAEERSFAYFHANTAKQFASPFRGEFWNHLVLQIGQREQCVKKALVALGALHESFMDEHPPQNLLSPLPPRLLNKPNWKLTNLATASYTYALRDLKKHINTDDGLHISLLCCILFTSFEWLRGSYEAATTHLVSGLHILRQWSSMPQTSSTENTPTAHFIRKHLAPIFVRLSIQARTIAHDVAPMPWLANKVFAAPSATDIRSEEEHLHAARNALGVLCADVYLGPYSYNLFSRDLAISQPALFNFSTGLAKWLMDYHRHLLPLSSPLPQAARPENVNLTLWYTVLSLMQCSEFPPDPMAVDNFTPQFQRIVDLSRIVSCSYISPPPTQGEQKVIAEVMSPPRFRIDMEVVPMLYHVASKCRHPFLRREAITLLRQGAGREGLWDGWAAAALAEDILTVEEAGVDRAHMCGPESIPRTQRVIKVNDVTDLQARKTRVRYQQYGQDGYGEWRILTW